MRWSGRFVAVDGGLSSSMRQAAELCLLRYLQSNPSGQAELLASFGAVGGASLAKNSVATFGRWLRSTLDTCSAENPLAVPLAPAFNTMVANSRRRRQALHADAQAVHPPYRRARSAARVVGALVHGNQLAQAALFGAAAAPAQAQPHCMQAPMLHCCVR